MRSGQNHMFSQKAEYALRAVVWLAEYSKKGPLSNQEIAQGTEVPPTYLAKIFQELVKAKIVSSRRGVGGGFELEKDSRDITLLDVVNAVDPIRRHTDCPLKLKSHKKKHCPIHTALDAALDKLEGMLSGSSIFDILRDDSHPKAMRE